MTTTFREIPSIQLLTTARSLGDGYAPGHLSRKMKNGDLVPLAPGVYADALDWMRMSEIDRHLVLCRAISDRAGEGAVLGFESAALLQGISFLGKVPEQVQLVAERSGKRIRRVSAQSRSTTQSFDPVNIQGLWCTPPARTVIDLAATHPFESGLIAADSALRQRIVTPEELLQEADARMSFPGSRKVVAVITRADGASGSAGESLSRGRCYQLGARIPSLQKRFIVNGNTYYVDFYWEELDVIGEFDGAVKYETASKAPDSSALIAEKVREDGLRERVKSLRRWGWNDAYRITRFERILREIGAITGPPVRLLGLQLNH